MPNPDIPVYILYNEADKISKRTLHRNHLLPIGRTADDRSDTQGTANDHPATSKRRPVPRPRKRTSHTTNQGKPSSIVSNKQNLPTNSEEENEGEDVRVEVHELKTAESQESETAVTLTAQEGEQRCEETAPQRPNDGPGMSVGAWDTRLGGDDHSPIEDGVARHFVWGVMVHAAVK